MTGQADRGEPSGTKGKLRFFDIIYYVLCGLIAFCSLSIVFSKAATGESISLIQKGVYVINSDYPMFYYAGKVAAKLGAQSLYDTVAQLNVLNASVKPVQFHSVPLLPYPPQLYLLMVVPALLPIHLSFFVWVLGGILISVSSVYTLCKSNSEISPVERVAFTFALLAIFPMYFYMVTGQASPLWLLFLTIFFFAACKQRSFISGLSIALMAMKPPFALIVSVISIALGQWKQVIYGCGIFVLSMLLPSFIWGFNIWGDYLLYFQEWSKNADGSMHPERQPSTRWLINMAPSEWQFVLNGLSLIICITCIWLVCWKSRGQQRLLPSAFTASIASMQFWFPYMHMYDSIIVWAAISVSLKSFAPSKLGSLSGWSDKIFHAVVLTYPFIGVGGFLLMPDFANKFNIPFVFANALLFASSMGSFFSKFKE